jgi:hypothetical protein
MQKRRIVTVNVQLQHPMTLTRAALRANAIVEYRVACIQGVKRVTLPCTADTLNPRVTGKPVSLPYLQVV